MDIYKQKFFPMQNVIQNFAWGSISSLNTLFGIENHEGKPQAELWMGAHLNGCSQVAISNRALNLSKLISLDMEAILGTETANQFGELPFLFKVLAAENALSIQVHPSKAQAEQGYELENNAGVDLNASNRNYRDANHKPELVYALTEYDAMNGFRDYAEIVRLFELVAIDELETEIARFKKALNAQGLEKFFSYILRLEGEKKSVVLDKLLTFAKANDEQKLFNQILLLAKQYPGDVGLLSPLMLNLITLKPGEAMFLDACTPHAYIKGTALEIMANSDNVLRAGLTPKHIDVDELVSCTIFEPKPFDSLLTEAVLSEGGEHYPVPVPDFKLSIYTPTESVQVEVQSAEVLMALESDLTLTHESGESVSIAKGESVFVPFSSESYRMQSIGRVARAYN